MRPQISCGTSFFCTLDEAVLSRPSMTSFEIAITEMELKKPPFWWSLSRRYITANDNTMLFDLGCLTYFGVSALFQQTACNARWH